MALIPDPVRLQQGQGVDADLVSNDEFKARQSHPIAGDRGQLESLVGVAQVDQDLGAGCRQILDGLLLHPVGHMARIHPALLAFAAAQRDDLPVPNAAGAIARPHHRGDAHFAGNDRRMAGPAALVGDHPAGLFEDGLPIGVRAPGHQHIPLLEALDFGGIADHPGPAMACRGANRTAADQRWHLVGIQPPRLQ